MDHRRISRMLKLAGWFAAAGIIFVFYLSTPLRIGISADQAAFPWMLMLCKAAAGIPYLLALADYFRICSRIGENRSFCRENVSCMARIAQALAIAGLVWIIAFIGHASGILKADFVLKVILCMDLLAMLASFAVAMVAKMMEQLLSRAAGLQEDSDLTI